MTAIMAARPHSTAPVSPALAAVCRYEPSPGRRRSRLFRTKASHAIRKNHPPATDIMEFHTSPMAAQGSSSWVKRCHQLSRYTPAASTSSCGIFLVDE